MAPIQIIDSHIHLWPASAANKASHIWMETGFILTREHLLRDYYKASQQSDSSANLDYQVRGVVYLETDRALLPDTNAKLESWTTHPLNEIRFLRSMVEGEYGDRDTEMLLALIPWAPMHRGKQVFDNWIELARQTAGEATWERVRGFRFLLQGITDRSEFENLVFSDDFVAILRSFREEGRDWSFDVGVSQHEGGVWQLEAFAKVLDRLNKGVEVEKQVSMVLNHLCKPDMTGGVSKEDFQRWGRCIEQFSSHPKVYMKLSGGFSELSNGRLDRISAERLVEAMKPWLDQVFRCFTSQRVMFGSDWPVCNVRGPATENSWTVWRDVIQSVLDQQKLPEPQRQRIWFGTAAEAYRLSTQALDS